MSMWRMVSEEERTELYRLIKGAVARSLAKYKDIDEKEIDIITDKIYLANKEYYDVHLTQMSEFISIQ